MASILVLHGPNLNLLGTREPEIYGSDTLEDVNQTLTQLAQSNGHHLQYLQSNAEYELIERIHAARSEGIDFIIINPAAFTLILTSPGFGSGIATLSTCKDEGLP